MSAFVPHEVLRRHPAPRLYPAGVGRIALEAPTPVSESLEWRLAARYWQRHGVAPFSDGSVPYVVNNSGWAPRAAAELVIAAAEDVSGDLIVLEVAAGSGVFARQALDHIQQRSEADGLDVYKRLTWVCTDGAARGVRAWRERGQFLDHEAHVHLITADALDLQRAPLPDGRVVGVIANYALDSLPVEVVRRGGERLVLQASILGQEADLERWVGMPFEDIQERVASAEPEALDDLLGLLDWLEVQAAFAPGEVPEADAALSAAQSDVAMVNTGALRFFDGALNRLSSGGFVLVNDYGPTTPREFETQTFIHRFGGTVTCALNFPHLDQWLERRGCRVLAPEGDEHRTIHTRLAVHGDAPSLETAFERWFSDPQYVGADRVAVRASSHVAAGRLSEALEVFERHLAWCPTDWHQLAEAAQLLMQHFGLPADALELADAARQLNPWSSTLVWNVYGSALYSMGALAEAEEAWTEATYIHRQDPGTWLNFGYLHAARGHTEKALSAIANGLACDRTGGLRAALLQKQGEILGTQSQIHTARTDRLTRRHRGLADAIRTPGAAE